VIIESGVSTSRIIDGTTIHWNATYKFMFKLQLKPQYMEIPKNRFCDVENWKFSKEWFSLIMYDYVRKFQVIYNFSQEMAFFPIFLQNLAI
jgi:hypothetical protein